MKTRYFLTGIAACTALVASGVAIAWLIRSSEHADRPPLYAIVALLFAIIAGTGGLALGIRTGKNLMRSSRNTKK